MPNIMIHEKVGYYFTLQDKSLDTGDFYLGLMAPDAVNLEGFASKEERWTSHIRDKDLTIWQNNIINFYKKELNNYPKNFILGYLIHILTDIIYDKYFYKEVIDKIVKGDGLTGDPHPIFLEYMKIYASNNDNSEEWVHIKEKLKNSNSYNILNIDSNKLLLWKEKNIEKKELITKENPYITEDLIKKIYDKVREEYDKI